MKATLLTKEKNDAKFTMTFSAEDFEKALGEAYQKNKGKFVVDGFRKGKAPRKLIESKFGEDVFYEDAINEMFAAGYPQALEELSLNPVDRPSADFGEEKIEKGKDFTVTITVTCMPEFEIKDYKGVKVEKIEHPVTDEDVNKELEGLQKRNARMVVVDRAAKEGDTVLIDYAGFVGEEQFEGGTAERQPLTLGSNTFIPGFEEQLIGANAGEERDVKVTFPEEYHAENLAGKEAVFKCKVHEIKEQELPALDDDFAKDVSEFDTLEELKKDTREKLEKAATEAVEYETKNAVLEKVYEANEIDIPDCMVEDQLNEMLQEFEQQLSRQGLNLQMYCQYLNKELKELREDLRADAQKKVKTRLVIEAVADAEKMEVSKEEMEKEMQAMADMYKMELSKLQAMMHMENLAYLQQDIKMRKAIEFMFENAIIE
ncbi:MAG: trigger factor [Anaerovorax sp.]|nr:trigger factor [Anaerovorax sp.]